MIIIICGSCPAGAFGALSIALRTQHAHALQELASPLNIADLQAAGRDTNSTIPIHVYLYEHYGKPWGWNITTPQELQVCAQLVLELLTEFLNINTQSSSNRRCCIRRHGSC
jgi:hypothetical protein